MHNIVTKINILDKKSSNGAITNLNKLQAKFWRDDCFAKLA